MLIQALAYLGHDSLIRASIRVFGPEIGPNKLMVQKNRLAQHGLLKRFSIDCYGKQSTIEKMREEKAEMYKKLKNKRNSKDYEWWFLRYIPAELDKDYKPPKKGKKKTKRKTRKKTKKRKKRKTRKVGLLSRILGTK